MCKSNNDLSSAEDFLCFLDVPFDPRIVAVNRLHILKRYHDYLSKAAENAGLDDQAGRAIHRDCLLRAYQDFVGSSAQQQKVFPVFHRGGPGFVGLEKIERR